MEKISKRLPDWLAYITGTGVVDPKHPIPTLRQCLDGSIIGLFLYLWPGQIELNRQNKMSNTKIHLHGIFGRVGSVN